MLALGLDTSNYTTSVAVFDGREGVNCGKLLEVRPGELGLRQSDALFQHVRNLPELFNCLNGRCQLDQVQAVGASTQPREVEGSYMPCFLAGTSQARVLADCFGVPFYAHSHQQGHLAAAAWSAGRMDLLDKPFLAWHLSGGTTELLLAEPAGSSVTARQIGGTSDISAGQLIDRTGVRLGLQFPAGKALDALYDPEEKSKGFRVKLDGFRFSLSGMENKMQAMAQAGEKEGKIAAFVLDTITQTVVRVTAMAQEQWPGLPVLCSGGVASNRQLRGELERQCGAIFAQPQYATDNAVGTAILTWRRWKKENEG